MARLEKVACPKCRNLDVPGFDGKCKQCAGKLDDPSSPAAGMQAVGRAREHGGIRETNTMKCGICEAIVEGEGHFCTQCGATLSEAAGAGDAAGKTASCSFCGKTGITEERCPRCHEAVALEAKDDDEDDTDDGEDDDGDDDEDDDKEDGKKKLFDKSKKEARNEGQVYVDLAMALREEKNPHGLDMLAAHIVYGESNEDVEITDRNELAENPPPWVASQYAKQWKEAVHSPGRPRTFMAAAQAFTTTVSRL